MPRWADKILEERRRAKPIKKNGVYTFTGSEDDLQIFCAEYNDARGLCWHHVPNERRDIEMFGKLKKKGLKAGSPDIMIFSIPPRFQFCRGAAFELKVGNNKVTKHQEDFLARLAACKWWTAVIRSPEEYMLEMERLGWG